MAQATISARVDSTDKIAFDSFCNDVGISSSAAINMFVKAVLREHRIPFSINNDPSIQKEIWPFYGKEFST